MKIAYSHSINGEPVFTGEIQGQPFAVIRLLSDVDYGWAPLNYLPGQDGGSADQHWDHIEQYLWHNDQALLSTTE